VIHHAFLFYLQVNCSIVRPLNSGKRLEKEGVIVIEFFTQIVRKDLFYLVSFTEMISSINWWF